MSCGEDEDIMSIQKRLNFNINILEDKIKQNKSMWNYIEHEIEKPLLEHLVENHYTEIVYHINQIRHHLEKINYHKKGIDEIDLRLKVNNNQLLEITGTTQIKDENNSFKRSDEDKLRSKIRRVTRASSLKYVEQWEKMLEEQKEESFLNMAKRRWKSQDLLDATELSIGETADNDVSKTMVKNRIQKFEGIAKPKRASSTVEAFLDLNLEKPCVRRGCTIVEDAEGEGRRSSEYANGDGDTLNDANSNPKASENALIDETKVTKEDLPNRIEENQFNPKASENTIDETKVTIEDLPNKSEENQFNPKASENAIDETKVTKEDLPNRIEENQFNPKESENAIDETKVTIEVLPNESEENQFKSENVIASKLNKEAETNNENKSKLEHTNNTSVSVDSSDQIVEDLSNNENQFVQEEEDQYNEEPNTENPKKPRIVGIHIQLTMKNTSTIILDVNQGLIALRQEILKFQGSTRHPQYLSICGMLMGNLVVLENIRTNGNKRAQQEADIVIKYLKELKQLIDSRITSF